MLYKALIFVGTVAFIVYFLPRDGKFNYQFDINKPWKYGQLMATFDFPIYKDEAVVKREQDSLLASFQPYFELDKEVEKSALAKLKENYHAHLKGILPSTDYIRYIERGLKAIYQSGVVSTEEMRTLLHDSISSVMVIEDKLANQRTTDGIYTVKRAYENLISGDPPIITETSCGNVHSTSTLPPISFTILYVRRQPGKNCSTTTPGQTE